MISSSQKRANFLPGAQGKVRDWSEDDFRRIRALYYGMISEVDAQLGRIWQALKAAGAWDDTIIVLTSDHAEMMGDHFMLGKGGFFDQQLPHPADHPRPARTARPRARTVDRFTEAVDIMPTLLDLLGEAPPAASRRTLAEAVPRAARRPTTGATRRIGSSISARSPSGERRAAFRHRLAPVQPGRHPHRAIQICAFRRRPAAAAVRSSRQIPAN